MSDVVAVFDAFETKRERPPKVVLEIEEWKIHDQYYVSTALLDGTVDRIEGVAT